MQLMLSWIVTMHLSSADGSFVFSTLLIGKGPVELFISSGDRSVCRVSRHLRRNRH